jgi:uncharacterized protein (TIGR00156 family)
MKKYTVFFLICCFAMLFAAQVTVFAQQSGGFTGPSAPTAPNVQLVYQAVTVSQMLALPNNSNVTLTGNIVQSNGYNNYTFRDASGDVIISIAWHYWWGLTVGPTDRVQILVEFERSRNGRIKVEVKGIRKL